VVVEGAERFYYEKLPDYIHLNPFVKRVGGRDQRLSIFAH